MPTSENPAAAADQAQAALRALAHATRSVEDPRQIYSVLGSLTSAVASLSQSLHQVARFHDGATKSVWATDHSPNGRAAAYQVAWELHRAGEMLHQIGECIANAHNAESSLTYVHRDFPATPATTDAPHRPAGHGLSR
ncbi:hypothetical protein GCM10027062_30510 [Nocardioides hungaricus]